MNFIVTLLCDTVNSTLLHVAVNNSLVSFFEIQIAHTSCLAINYVFVLFPRNI